MSAPDYTEQQATARAQQRERFAPGTCVTHVYDHRVAYVVKLHVGTLKRQKPLNKWTATVRWVDGRTSIHALDLLRPMPIGPERCEFCHGKPVADARTWQDGRERAAAACPRCGERH